MNEDANVDAVFNFSNTSYPKDYQHIYRECFEPLSAIQFAILLPFHLPVQDGTCFTMMMQDDVAHTYRFQTVATNTSIGPGTLTDAGIPVTVHVSEVEMVYVTAKEMNKDGLNPTTYFDDLLEGLNLFLVSYLILSKDIDAHKLSREMLTFASVYRAVHLPDWKEIHKGLFVLHMDVPYQREPMAEKQLIKIIDYAYALSEGWNPFMPSEEIALNARKYLKQGFYASAVFYAQISIESFFNALYIELLTFEGKTPEQAEEKRESTPFMSLVKSEFHPRIGGKWNIEDTSSEIGNWYSDVYLLRNRIAHGGYTPTYDEASTALSSAHDTRLYVASLIKARKKTYPILWSYLHMET